MRILFVGDVVGRSGRAVVTERLPGLIRDWKLDCVIVNGENAAGGFGITEAIYKRVHRGGGRCGHARQSRLGPEGSAGLHRARAAAHPADQLSGRHPWARCRADRCKDRRSRAGGQCHGPHLHGSAGRSLRGGRPRVDRLRVAFGCRRDPRRHARGDHQREAGDGLFLRRPRQHRRRARTRTRRPRTCASCRPAPRS